MKIRFSPYTLKGKRSREGFLLKVEYPDGKVGYSDLHAWPELGDESLQEQHANIKRGLLTNLSKRSLYFAKLDANARAEGVRLLENKKIPQSHFLASIGDEIPENEGWETVKIKVGPSQIKSLLKYLPTVKQRIRLDCNCHFDLEHLEELYPFFDRIEFIEDPAPYNLHQWKECLSKYKVTFAIDRLHKEILFDIPECVNIYKPAVESYSPHPRTVVTSYLGHPVGQLCAAYEASLLSTSLTAGLNSHRVYEPNCFSEQLNWSGPKFEAPDDVGFGFSEDLFDALEWRE